MTFDKLYKNMMRLAAAWRLDPHYANFSRQPRRSQIEATAHEASHAVCLGGPMSTTDVETILTYMMEADADALELHTLRVEVAALRRLGLRVNGTKILVQSSYNHATPSRAEFLAPLTKQEQRWVNKLVAAIESA